MSWYSFKPYVSAAQRRAKAAKKLKTLKAGGMKIDPLGELAHRLKIAASFWGRSWCRHLESLGDYENRLPRGRTYVRNGSVLHLHIGPGVVTALVQGSELYEQNIRIMPLSGTKWKSLQARSRGKIGSLIELLQGRISDEIMGVVTDPDDGLFPKPGEIKFDCSCPDWAGMCKHIAAVLYGVGARLDTRPELLFTLRGVDHNDLIAAAADGPSVPGAQVRGGKSRRRNIDALGSVFGIELGESASESAPLAPAPKPARSRPTKKATSAKPAKKKTVVVGKPVKKTKPGRSLRRRP